MIFEFNTGKRQRLQKLKIRASCQTITVDKEEMAFNFSE